MNSEDFNKFLDRFDIKILDNQKRCPKKTSLLFFTDSTDADICQSSQINDYEPLLTIQIPQSRIEDLAIIDTACFNNNTSCNIRRVFTDLMRKNQLERCYRNSIPAIKQAYEHYSLLLHLASSSQNE